ncbi:MAG: 4Fe-4S binding protein, partial [Desulfamplus sp.]|nr:4Fe-4S binding protein [Desulfamplus sp.]
MDFITIDQEKCVKDGICAAECPVLIINVSNGFPEITKGTEGFCIN